MTPAEARAAAAARRAALQSRIWGAGSVGELGEICAKAGMTRAMAVAGRSADSVAGRLPALLGQRYLGRWSDVLAARSRPPGQPRGRIGAGDPRRRNRGDRRRVGDRPGEDRGTGTEAAADRRAHHLLGIGDDLPLSGDDRARSRDRHLAQGAAPRRSSTIPICWQPMTQRIAATGVTAVAHCLEALCYPDVSGRGAGPGARGPAVAVGQPGQGRRRNGRPQLSARRPGRREPGRPRPRCSWPGPAAPALRPHGGMPRCRATQSCLRCCCRRCCARMAPRPNRRVRPSASCGRALRPRRPGGIRRRARRHRDHRRARPARRRSPR